MCASIRRIPLQTDTNWLPHGKLEAILYKRPTVALTIKLAVYWERIRIILTHMFLENIFIGVDDLNIE